MSKKHKKYVPYVIDAQKPTITHSTNTANSTNHKNETTKPSEPFKILRSETKASPGDNIQQRSEPSKVPPKQQYITQNNSNYGVYTPPLTTQYTPSFTQSKPDNIHSSIQKPQPVAQAGIPPHVTPPMSSVNTTTHCYNPIFERRIRNNNARKERGLPIYNYQTDIINSIQRNKFSIIVGETGCGKSTQLPQYLFEQYEERPGSKILWVLPRKLAATSLAQRVCEEMGLKLGQEIGYELPSRSEMSPNTVLKFTTDTVLINELIQKKTEGEIKLDYSVIVLDEVHERNLFTDILLATLKEVAMRSHMKLVVTSATINEEVFEKYFKVKAIHIEGRPYPVEKEYSPIPENMDPVTHITNTVCAVANRAENPQFEYKGHILVFTSGVEEIVNVESMLKSQINLGKYQIFPLHGNLSPAEQKAVFINTEKTKIILCTRLAETALTIDGVRVVIDLGIDKEATYDPNKRMTIVENKPIPQSSAIQRAGRAGRTSEGLCIRLYSEIDYEKLSRNKKPEIQRMNLCKVAMKLKAIGVAKIRDFDFVERPDPKVLDQTIEHLENLEALERGSEKLTEIGKAMLKFETEPDFARAIVEGYKRDCVKEVAGVVAMIGVSSGLFRRGVEQAAQENADRQKMVFCHKKGDLMTLLNIFIYWGAQQEEMRDLWCLEYCLSSAGLMEAYKVYTELLKGVEGMGEILKPPKQDKEKHKNSNKKEKIKQEDEKEDLEKERERKENDILKCFLRVFFPNVCVYTEIPKVGYILLRDVMTLKIHGASSLTLQGEFPKYLMCIDVNKTFYNNTKLASAIEPEWIEQLFPGYKQTDLKYLARSYSFQQYIEPNLGNHLLAYFAENKLPEIKNKADTCEYLFVVDYKEEKLYVYSTAVSVTEIKKTVETLVNQVKEDLSHEVLELPLTLKTRCIFEAGARVKELLLEKETQYMTFEGFDPALDEEILFQMLNKIGGVTYVFSEIDPATSLRYGIICMESANDVEKVMDHYNQKQLEIEMGKKESVIKPQLKLANFGANNSVKKALRLRIEWFTGRSNCKASLLFKNEYDVMDGYEAIVGTAIDGKTVYDYQTIAARGAKDKGYLTLNFSKNNPNILSLYNLTPNTDDFMIERALQKTVPGLSGCKVFRDDDHCSFVSMEKANEVINFHLDKMFSKDRTYIAVQEPEENTKEDNFRRKIDLDVYDHEVGTRLVQYFDGKRLTLLTQGRIYCTLSFMRKIQLKYANYQVIVEDIQDIVRKIMKDRGSEVKIIEDTREFLMFDNHNRGVVIRIIAQDPLTVDKCYNMLNVAVKGVYFHFENAVEMKKAEFESIKERIKDIEKTNNVSIELDKKRKALVVFGRSVGRDYALKAVTALFRSKELNKQHVYEEKIVFKYLSVRDLLMKRDVIFAEAEEKYKVHIWLSVLSKEITIIGDEISVKKTQESLMKYIKNRNEKDSSTEECPICCEEFVEGYRLQVCGHKFCFICLEAELNETLGNNPQFPLLCSQCLAEDKKVAICVKDLRSIFKAKISTVWERSIDSYLRKNEKAYFRCFTANCAQIFRQNEKRCFRCDYCMHDYCKKCKGEAHVEENCNDANIGLKKALKKAGCKECPHCGAYIEKNGGCDKMKCAYCKTMFCWLCSQAFPVEGQVYAHLNEVHGRIGDLDPANLAEEW